MKAYKATYNFKCRNQEYKIGKTYTADKMKICECGIHFCERMDAVLNYYEPINEFKLLEIEVLGDVIFECNKGVTNKIKVIREIPFEEFPKCMRERFPVSEYDSQGNKISETYPTGDVYRYEYDSMGNMTSEIYPNGNVYRYKYDSQGNKISETYPTGDVYRYEYDYRGNRIRVTTPRGDIHRYEYDSMGNMTSEIYPNGNVHRYEYDSQGNIISMTCPDGKVLRYDVATITESDD